MTDTVRQDNPAGSALRFATELVAWVATPWALAPHSVPLAILSVIVLIGLPTLFSTPGDKRNVIVPVPGFVTILLVLLQLVAAVAASWAAWPIAVAVVVSALAVATVVFEVPRWRWLLSRGSRP
ncbi:hypothetical protein GCM10010149_78130 [Nonomuraea roseoviolacea subsp. roseoviolacea]|uniref:Integral membrane protein n=1 Tax=Nonomuraea roseoviolacea subsp. carminata TaxID=160689 RepID=A0ABT1KA95_9ACTN|nr:hypothetical protein [Nonomuraea roseoviolacea]MCP2350529.1 hypothetical protein [Nonomuraea roseoviolacea subsp. carminata]